jgi:hypothetical protein
MKLYSESTILKRLESLKISNPSIFFDGMIDEEPISLFEEKANVLILETVSKFVAAEIGANKFCSDNQLTYFFSLANKIINCITNKTLPNV